MSKTPPRKCQVISCSKDVSFFSLGWKIVNGEKEEIVLFFCDEHAPKDSYPISGYNLEKLIVDNEK